ncbi:MAG: hypothetical protein GWN13_29735, partial [Phycisphaerae bacterium]|nr:hypothetical protein [Phycisphaerae bacterium]
MADQHNTNIPAMGNQISNDIPDIKENLEFHKDVLQKITGGWSDSATTNVIPGNAGAFKRSKFEYSSTTAIKLYPAFYHHAGTTDQMCYWSSTLTFTLGSGGSNSGSEDLDAGAVEIQYIYLDDSAIVTAASN